MRVSVRVWFGSLGWVQEFGWSWKLGLGSGDKVGVFELCLLVHAIRGSMTVIDEGGGR